MCVCLRLQSEQQAPLHWMGDLITPPIKSQNTDSSPQTIEHLNNEIIFFLHLWLQPIIMQVRHANLLTQSCKHIKHVITFNHLDTAAKLTIKCPAARGPTENEHKNMATTGAFYRLKYIILRHRLSTTCGTELIGYPRPLLTSYMMLVPSTLCYT